MITGRVVGNDAVIAWLRAVTDTAASGLARAIAELCLDLQRKSLKPNVDRLTKCVEFLLSEEGHVLRTQFYSAVIRSQCRFNYKDAFAILQRPPRDSGARSVPRHGKAVFGLANTDP